MADNWSSYMCCCNHPRNTHRFVHESRCWSYREGKACMEILKREREFVPVVCKLSVQAATVSSLTFSRRHSHRLKFPIIIHHMNQLDAQTIRDELSLSILAVFRFKDLDVFISFWQKMNGLDHFLLERETFAKSTKQFLETWKMWRLWALFENSHHEIEPTFSITVSSWCTVLLPSLKANCARFTIKAIFGAPLPRKEKQFLFN